MFLVIIGQRPHEACEDDRGDEEEEEDEQGLLGQYVISIHSTV